MLHTISPADMKCIEARFMAETKTEPLTLMERAATHVADAAMPFLWHGAKLLVLCGTGNNGGDGLAAARILLSRFETLQCVVYQLAGKQSPETAVQAQRLAAYSDRMEHVLVDREPPVIPSDCACIIDALFGTGLSRPLSGAALTLAEDANRLSIPVVSVDIPSGLDGATGYAPEGGAVVQADVTVSFHRLKEGLILGDGPDVCGEIRIGDLGIPLAYGDVPGFAVMETKDVQRSSRRKNSHKGSYGRLLTITGSAAMPGAAGISALAALRTGAGTVTVACPKEIVQTVIAVAPCATALPLLEDSPWPVLESALGNASALVAGCGLGQSHAVFRLVERLIHFLCTHALPAVLDADALNVLAKYQDTFLAQSLRFPAHVVLTPHLGEAARLLRWSIAEVTQQQVRAAQELHRRYGGSLILKSATSVLIAEDGQAINRFGTPAMAKAGSGDTLAGVLGALLAGQKAYSLHGIRLMQTACAFHGLAGEAAAQQYGEHGVLATDVCEYIARI